VRRRARPREARHGRWRGARQSTGADANICSMTSSGSPYARFRRALATGNLTIIRAAAAELPWVDLGDALAVCMAIRDAEPDRFERAAVRWLARYAAEQARTIADVREAVAAMQAMPSDPGGALDSLRRLCQ
jgi:hypothetical protein